MLAVVSRATLAVVSRAMLAVVSRATLAARRTKRARRLPMDERTQRPGRFGVKRPVLCKSEACDRCCNDARARLTDIICC